MGKKSREKLNRRINREKDGTSKSESTGCSPCNTEELMDLKEYTLSRCDGVQIANFFPRVIIKEDSRNESNEEIKGEHSSIEKNAAQLLRNVVKETVYLINIRGDMNFENLFFRKNQEESSYLSEIIEDFMIDLMTENKEEFEYIMNFIMWMTDVICIQNYPFVKIKLKEVPICESYEALSTIEDDLIDIDKAMALTIVKVENNFDGKNSNENLSLLPSKEKYQVISLLEFHQNMKERLALLRSERKTTEELLIQSKSRKHLELIRKLKHNFLFHKLVLGRLYNKPKETLEKVNSDQKNHTEILEKVKTEQKHHAKSKNSKKYRIHVYIDFLPDRIVLHHRIVWEKILKENIYTEDINRPNDDNHVSNSNKEMLNLSLVTKNCDRRDNKKEIMRPQPAIKFEETTRKAGKVETEENNCSAVNLGQLTEEINNSTEKEPLIAVGETKPHKLTQNAINDGTELNDEQAAVVIDLSKKDSIHFEFESNDNKHVYAGKQNEYYPLNDNGAISFHYKDENVQVCFTGNQIFITTEDNEFNIFIRRSNPNHLTDEATQTITQE